MMTSDNTHGEPDFSSSREEEGEGAERGEREGEGVSFCLHERGERRERSISFRSVISVESS